MEILDFDRPQEIDEIQVPTPKQKKQVFTTVGIALLCDLLIQVVLIFVTTLLILIVFIPKDGDAGSMLQSFDIDAMSSFSNFIAILATIGSTVFVVKIFGRSLQCKVTVFNNPYSFKKIIFFTIVGMGLSSLAGYLFLGVQMLLSQLGILFITPDFNLTFSLMDNILMIITTCLVAPVFEEWLFRGLIVGVLKKYGNVFAIVVSALLFALMHGNLIQSIPAFFIGLVLAYVTIESGSLIPAIVMHFINNAFAMTAGVLGTTSVMYWVFTVFEVIMICFAVFIIWKYKKQIKYYREKHKGEKVSSFFKNWACVIFLVMMLIGNIMFISIA